MTVPEDLARRLRAVGQEHLLRHAEELEGPLKARFIRDLERTDFQELARLFAASAEEAEPQGPLEPLPCVVRGADTGADRETERIGWELLREGRVAAFLVAGGQGSRLGHPGPKGTFRATPVAGKPLYRLFAEKLRARARAGRARIPLYIMTSPDNHEETVSFFEENSLFGLDREDLQFLVQGVLPAMGEDGRVLLEGPGRIFTSPDGHGGSLRALDKSGALADMRTRGVDVIFYFQVDNPLVRLCDPVFLGHHVLSRSEFSSKAVPKSDPYERVGILLSAGGVPRVIEYSDLPDELRHQRDEDGRLRFRAGSIAIHAMQRSFVERLNDGGLQLPHHRARKRVTVSEGSGSPAEVQAVKLETFVFDALPRATGTLVMEVAREEEFAPIKNRHGADSPRTSREAQSRLHASWLEGAGVQVPRDKTGNPLHAVEIGPLFADGPGVLARREGELPGVVREDLLLDEA